VEAILLAGGKAERLGAAAQGRPKPLVPVAGRPLAAYQVGQLARAGVERVIVSCAAGAEGLFEQALSDLGPELGTVPEPEPLGRGGGLRLAAAARREQGPLYALNGDELLDVDLAALLAQHRALGAAATVTLTPLQSPFGIVDLDDGDLVTGFQEAPRLPHWVNVGVYVLDDEALARLPERGDHERTTFPELAAERRLAGYRHEGTWLTVNTPKQLRLAEEFVSAHPEWLAA
jgi:NDP-sugar pyrophosphorylase family protein